MNANMLRASSGGPSKKSSKSQGKKKASNSGSKKSNSSIAALQAVLPQLVDTVGSRQAVGVGRAVKRAQTMGGIPSRAGYYRALASQITNPTDVVDPLVLPDPGGGEVTSRKFTRIVDVNQATYPTLSVYMSPNLYAPGLIAGGGAGAIPSNGAGALTLHGTIHTNGVDGNLGLESSNFRANAAGEAGVFAIVHQNAPGHATPQPGFLISVAANSYFNFTVRNVSNTANAIPQFMLYGSWAGVDWTQMTDTNNTPISDRLAQNDSASYKVHSGVATTGLAFVWSGSNGRHLTFDIELQFDNAQMTPNAATSFAPAFGEAIIEDKITKGRVTGMSMLISNTSADLANGGTICAGRVPHSFDFFSPMAPNMAKLPKNRWMSGPAKTGSYVWWLPAESDEWDINDVNVKQLEYHTSNILAAQLSGWPAGASARVTFTWVVEFYTENDLFTKIVPPPSDNEYALFKAALSRGFAATHNPDHEAVTGQIANTVGKYAKDLAGYVKEYGPMVMFVLEALAALA